MRKRVLVVLAVMVVLSISFTVCPYSTTTLGMDLNSPVNTGNLYASELKYPTQYIYEVEGTPGSLDPVVNYEIYGLSILELVYERLVDYKGDSWNEIEGKLATSWTLENERTTYVFTLRQDVTFHDGTPFNAYVMKYSLDRAMIMDKPSLWLIEQSIKGGPLLPNVLEYLDAGGIIVRDDYTLEINLEAPYADFLHALTFQLASAVSPVAVIDNVPSWYTEMVSLRDWFGESFDPTKLGLPSDHDLAISGVAPGLSHDWMNDHAVGTGPYRFEEMDRGVQVQLEKNTGWWGSFAKDSVDEVIFKTVNDVEERLTDFRNGDADEVSIIPSFRSMDYSYAAEVIDDEGNPVIDGSQVFEEKLFGILPLGMNQRDILSTQVLEEDPSSTYDASSLLRYFWDTQTASEDNPFTSLLFREAVALTFNRDAFISDILYGFAEPMEGLIPNGLFGHDDKLAEEGYIPPYNLEAATALFQLVGWRGTITLAYPGGHRVFQEGYHLLANAITGLDVGITVEVVEISPSDYNAAIFAGDLPIFFCTWLNDIGDPNNLIPGFLRIGAGWWVDRLGYNNPDLCILIDEAAIAPSSDRENQYHQIEKLAAEDYLYIYTAQRHRLSVVRDWIIGYESSGSLNPNSFFTNVEYVDKALPATADIVPKVVNTVRGSLWITAYIELPYGIDPSEIELNSVTMSYAGSSQPAVTDPSYAWVTDSTVYIVDQDGDGVLERLVRFDRNAFITGIAIEDPGRGRGIEIMVRIDGFLLDGSPFMAWSTLTIVSRGR